MERGLARETSAKTVALNEPRPSNDAEGYAFQNIESCTLPTAARGAAFKNTISASAQSQKKSGTFLKCPTLSCYSKVSSLLL